MRTSTGKGSGAPREYENTEIQKVKVTEGLEVSETTLDSPTLDDTITEDLSSTVQESISDNQKPESFDAIDWDGGERLPEGFDEVVDLIQQYEINQYSKKLSEEEELRMYLELSELRLKDALNTAKATKDEAEKPEECNDEIEEIQDPFPDEGNEKSSKVGLIAAIACAILVIASVMGTLFYVLNSNTITVKDIQVKVNRLYTSQAKSDIKKSVTEETLSRYYIDIDKLDSRKKKADSAVSLGHELDTIGYFLQDKATLREFDSENYNLATDGLLDNIKTIRENASNYAVPGLALTITDLCTKLEKEIETYNSLKEELSSITDYASFFPEVYEKKIDSVKHTENKRELKALFDNIVFEKAQLEAKEQAAKQINEETKRKAEEAQRKAEEEQSKLKQELQDAKAQLESESTPEETDDYVDEEMYESEEW